jgi:hypothetical protein
MSRKLPPGDPDDPGDGLDVVVVSRIEQQTRLVPVVREYQQEVVGIQRLVLVGEADPAVQLRVSGALPVESGHADQDQTQVAAVEEVAELLEADGTSQADTV